MRLTQDRSMAVLLFLAAGMIIFLAFVTFALKATGRPLYNERISRTAKTIWGTGFAIALGIVALVLGPGVIVATWPFWVGTLAFTVAVFVGLDRLFGGKPRQERTIVHRDGSRAVVDGRDGTGYRRLSAPETRRESGVVAAIDRLLGD